jgi:NAD(P)-dependent dehydrogenase (short-subunit alcohol dehydrogenase family)
MAMDSFAGKLAVVTGVGSGMGRELTPQLAAQDRSVAGRDPAPELGAAAVG